MEVSSNSMSMAISLTCILVTILLSWRVLNWVWFNPKRVEKILKRQGFKGNSYKLLYGDIKEMTKMRMESRLKPMFYFSNDHISGVLPFYYRTLNTHGTKCYVWDGPVAEMTIREPKQIREVLTRINEFQKPRTNPFLKIMIPGLFQLEGRIWAKRRKLLNPAFHVEKLKLMLPAFSESVTWLIGKWEKLASDTGTYEVDVWSDLETLFSDVISRAAFGSSYEEGERVFQLITQQFQVAIPILTSLYLPGWRFVPTKANRRVMQIDREIKSLLKDLINKRLMAIKAGKKPKDDLLGILLDSSLEGNEDDIIIGKNMKHKTCTSLEEVIDECQNFYLAGQGTTSTLLVWTLILLAKYQHWQKQARDEVVTVFGNTVPDFNGLNQLKTVTMILQEVLRLYPPAPELRRTVYKDTKVGDIIIPSSVVVNLPLLDVQHDEKLWGADAKFFNPERFAEGVSKATGGNMTFFSFSWGPRICIGSNFAMTAAKFALVMILRRFSFELSPAYVHAPAIGSTLQPQFGAQMIIRRL